MKKAQGLTLDVIIIAAIVLIVLVILWAIFTGRMSEFANSLREADAKCADLCKAAGNSNGEIKSACAGAETKLKDVRVKDTTVGSSTEGKIVTQACCCTPAQ